MTGPILRQNAEVRPYSDTPNLTELLGELSFSSFREVGFDRLLLVEGKTDAPVYRHFLRLLNADHKTVVIPLGGNQLARGDIDHELAELKRLTTSVYAIVDSEKASADAPPIAERQSFAQACERTGIPVLLTARRATENYLSDAAVKASFGEQQRGFGEFELRKDVKPSWRKEDNWKIAERMTWNDIADTDIGKFLKEHFSAPQARSNYLYSAVTHDYAKTTMMEVFKRHTGIEVEVATLRSPLTSATP